MLFVNFGGLRAEGYVVIDMPHFIDGYTRISQSTTTKISLPGQEGILSLNRILVLINSVINIKKS